MLEGFTSLSQQKLYNLCRSTVDTAHNVTEHNIPPLFRFESRLSSTEQHAYSNEAYEKSAPTGEKEGSKADRGQYLLRIW